MAKKCPGHPGSPELSHGLRHPLEENPVLPVHDRVSQIMTAWSHQILMGSVKSMIACHQPSINSMTQLSYLRIWHCNSEMGVALDAPIDLHVAVF